MSSKLNQRLTMTKNANKRARIWGRLCTFAPLSKNESIRKTNKKLLNLPTSETHQESIFLVV